MTKRKIEYWVIPPEADAEFVASMENVLETYARPYDPACPVICMDEQPVQLVKETRTPLPATKAHARRVDYEYERNGTASIFMFCEPLAAWRQATARPQRTKADWAQEVAALLLEADDVVEKRQQHDDERQRETMQQAQPRQGDRRLVENFRRLHGAVLHAVILAGQPLCSDCSECWRR